MSPPPRRSLAKPRLSQKNGTINTASTPNLNSTFSQPLQSPVITGLLRSADGRLIRKTSLNALTSGSLATIPDASEGYALSAVLDQDSSPSIPAAKMSRRLSPHGGDDREVEVGDVVDVPGNMYGTVKFVGTVYGKKGTFAGVELSDEFADRGKNNGDVDGRSYFATTNPGAGIFLPIARAIKRASPGRTPTTPGYGNLRLGASTPGLTPPTPSMSKFSQSLGPGRAPSPSRLSKARPSIPRPESPIRRPQTAGPGTNLRRPSLGAPQVRPRYAPSPTPTPSKFAQSVRGTQDSRDPMKKLGSRALSPTKSSYRSASALGQQQGNYSDDELTPIGMARTTTHNDSMGSVSSFNAKLRPTKAYEEEIERLKSQVDKRDRQLKEQASSLAEMENSLIEVQSLMGSSDNGSMRQRATGDDRDAAQLRNELREKKEKIAMLTAEFDAHRADFRSTIDTLELASTETERVYEQKVQELLAELRDYQDRSEDVDSVARQLKQLEELVQELEEGLEDARRGEAEARGEVEFLRGEVERGRSELKRERDKAAALSNGDNSNVAKEIMQRDDEIRGLKAIIHSLSRDGIPDTPNGDAQRTPTQSQRGRPSFETADDRLKLEREIGELKSMLENKNHKEEELERELEQLRRGGASGTAPNHSQRTSAQTLGSNGTIVPEHSSARDSRGTSNSWRDRSNPQPNTLETMAESDAQSSVTDGTEGTLWCQMCETGGHDILNCTNMFGNQTPPAATTNNRHLAPMPNPPPPTNNGHADGTHDNYKPLPLSPIKKTEGLPPAPRIIPNPMEPGPVAGKESGVIDENRWCALCERDGHESVDCPFEDAF